MRHFHKLIFISLVLAFGLSSISAKPKKKSTKSKKAEEIENKLLNDFINRRSYVRDGLANIPSPFRNLIVSEKNRLLREKKLKNKIKTDKENQDKKGVKPEDLPKVKQADGKPIDKLLAKQIAIKKVNDHLVRVDGLTKNREYTRAESLLSTSLTILAKHDAKDTKDKVKKKRKEVLQEHADWDIINGVINGLTVDAMFTAKGNRKIALINDSAIEEGEDLNEVLNLNKIAPIKLSFVSTNSITVQYKKFTLKKDLIDNDL